MYHVYPKQFRVSQMQMKNIRHDRLVWDKDNSWDVKVFLLIISHKKMALYINVLFMLLSICGFAYIAYVKTCCFHEIKQHSSSLVTALSCLSEFLLFVFIPFGLLNSTRAKFMSKIVRVLFSNEAECKSKFRSLKIYIYVQRYLPLVPVLIEVYFCGYYIRWNHLFYHVLKNIWYYIMNILICSFAFIANKVTEKFTVLNDSIEDLGNSYCTLRKKSHLAVDPVNFFTKYSEIQKSMDLSKHYNHLCNLLDKFNKDNKSVTVAFALFCTVTMLYYCSLITDIIAHPKGNESAVITISVMSAVFASLGQAAAIAFVGENLQEEGERTSRICLKFLNKLRRNMKNAQEDQIVNELTFLLEQSRTRKICFHAGGFFTLNWGILGSIISTVATYSIVIIQFLLK